MEKRFFIALALSFLVISVYSGLKGKQHVANEEVAITEGDRGGSTASSYSDRQIPPDQQFPSHQQLSSDQQPTTDESGTSLFTTGSKRSAPVSSTFEASVFDDEALETATFETDKLILTLSKRGGYIKTIDLKDPRARMSFRGIGAVRGWTDALFEMRRSADGFVLEYKPGTGEEVIKKFSFETPLSLALKVSINGTTNLKSDNYDILFGAVGVKDKKDPIGPRYLELAYYGNAVARRPLLGLRKPIFESGDMGWVGLRDKYFCQVVVPEDPGINGFKVTPVGDYRFVWTTSDSLNSAQARMYFGPQDEKALRKFEDGANQIVSYGKFDIIAKPLLLLLRGLQRVTKNWGLAIVLMTIIVYTLLSPLSLKSMKSMRRMQAMQPQVEALKVRFKDNPQKLNAETMELYRREKVNPFGGCLPILMQIPVFFSLYQVLMRSIELKGRGFLWIKDLSEPDRLFSFGTELPIIGSEFNLLPILMAALMVLQQKITTKSSVAASPEMAQQQKIMGTIMPVVFGVLFYRISSGLVLYWFTNSLLSVVFQWKVNKTVNGGK